MPTADPFLHHPDPLTREIARGYAGGSFLMDNGDGLQWYTVGTRALVPLGADLHVPTSLRRQIGRFQVAVDMDFAGVLAGCRDRPADETWISDELADIYLHLHRTGLAHSFETWQDGQLAGGVLGLVLGGAFIGETMYHRVTHASKVALVQLSRHLTAQGFVFLDAQIQNPHLARFGTYELGAAAYRKLLKQALGTDADL
ncbi:leucyl/phenylalanyl-tRNA--protein transferase [Deinococcus aquiradiocola]|uniref:Leucyl/phenylalanyl-tRNA--protein transferase n=1 Tax=Deinococcus aquiradiocola TaxID=393059 RepID=A0A917P675_9DEIO|nr:leucyl/phenylalanyl-tRNA--protein transferase [Deinococcus aquiradiocola]GGJ63517.1 leucyl/phenylalanyl-tRNA--protein transferase [Deinococcus aquiradiocola]